MLAGTREQFARYDALHGVADAGAGRTIIIGGGRVGRAVAATLAADSDLVLVGDVEAESRFIERYGRRSFFGVSRRASGPG